MALAIWATDSCSILGQAYLTKFYTDICQISPGVVSLIFAVTKIFDAFMDPIAGAFVDGRKKIGKHGRFRPVMMDFGRDPCRSNRGDLHCARYSHGG